MPNPPYVDDYLVLPEGFIMKKKLMAVLMVSLIPSVVLADTPDQCALDSTCSFSIRGKFNKAFITSQLKAGETYSCSVVRGKGRLLSIKSIYASEGISYALKGARFNKPFVIYGPKKGSGYVQYTIYNNNDPWHTDYIQFECKSVH